MALVGLIIALVISFGTFGCSLYGLHRFWLKPHHSDIPVWTAKSSRSASIKKSDPEDYKSVKSLRELIKVYIPLILDLDSGYWIKNVGLEGYTYLYFQKTLIKLLVVIGIASCLVIIPSKIFIGGESKVLKSTVSITIEAYEEELHYFGELRSIFDVLLLYFVSLYSIYVMFGVKDHVKSHILEYNITKSEWHNYERLKARSVHVRGVFVEDRSGEALHHEISSFLDMSIGGRIVSMLVVPDFINMVDLENSRKRVENAHKLYLANEPAVRRMCFPKKFRNSEYYERKLRSIDDKIEKEITKPLLCSGDAFICFDSLKTRNHCLKCFSSEKVIISGNYKAKALKRRMTSTFQKFDDENIVEDLKARNLEIVMTPLESPFDLFWSNMGGSREYTLFRRVLINVISFLILATGSFLEHIVLPIYIILLNQVLLFFIDYSAYMENHRSFTLCQMSIFFKSLFYLMLNTLIIPAFTLAAQGSLFDIVVHQGFQIHKISEQFYQPTTGAFFVIFLLQNGAFSSSSQMLRIGEVFNSFGSTWLAHYQRNYLNDLEKWRKKESDVFRYGNLYAQIVTAYYMTVSYSISTPGIILAGLAYLLMRYSVDGFHLLTIFKMEIESGGHMIESILKYTTGSCLILQFGIAISFGINGYIVSCILAALLFLLTIFLTYRMSKSFITEEELNTMHDEESWQDHMEDIGNWERAYRHPLLVANLDVGASKDSRAVSTVTAH